MDKTEAIFMGTAVTTVSVSIATVLCVLFISARGCHESRHQADMEVKKAILDRIEGTPVPMDFRVDL